MNHVASSPTFALECAQASDLGMRRMNNQDAVAVAITDDATVWRNRGHLLMVADGMGAHAAGELASKLAVDNIPHTYFKFRDLYPPAALRQAIREANSVVHAKGQSSVGFQGMGTTCSCLVLLPQGALVAHIGDSRVYRLRGSSLEQLTFDHSLVWEMAAAGHMAEEDVPAYIPKNVITRSLGPHPTVHVDLEGPYDVAAGDVFLLCSDGLSGQVSDEEMGAILQCLPPEDAVPTLVDLANLRGGPDNISVIVARVKGEPAPGENGPPATAPPSPARPPRWTASMLVAAGALLGLLGYCVWNRYWTGALFSAVALAAALVASRRNRNHAFAPASPAQPIGGPYGNGPYRKIKCEPNRQIVDSLAEIAANLRELAGQTDAATTGGIDASQPSPTDQAARALAIDWQPFDAARQQAVAAADAGDHRAAVSHYCRAIRDVMRQLRNHRPPGESGSGVNLA